MVILRILDEYLVRIRRNCSSNVTVRLKTPKLGKVSIFQVETPPAMTLEKPKFSIKSIMIARKCKKNKKEKKCKQIIVFRFVFLHF